MNLLGFKISLQNSAKALTRKSATVANVAFNYIQNSMPFSIGDSAKNHIHYGYNKNALIYSIINTITSPASKSHIRMFDVSDDENKIELFGTPFQNLLHSPNPLMKQHDFIKETLSYYLVTGECFIVKNRYSFGSLKGMAGSLVVLPPQFMDILQGENGLPISYKYWDGKNKQVYDADDVIFIRMFNPEGGIRGMSPLKAGGELLAMSNDSYLTNRKLIANGGPSGFLQLGDEDSDTLDDPQKDKLREKWLERYGTPNNKGLPLITSGKITWTPIGSSPDDLMLSATQRMTMRDLCNLYGISSQLLNDPENKTYSNMQEASEALIRNVVIPNVKKLLSALSSQLLSEYEKADGKEYALELDCNVWEELREDEAKKATMLASAYWMTINEKRKAMGMDVLDIPEGNDMYVPMNMLPLATGADNNSDIRNAFAAATQGVAAPITEEEPIITENQPSLNDSE